MVNPNQEAENIWQEFVYLGGKSLHYKRQAQLLIPKLAKNKIYLKHGFATLTEAAAKVAGIGKHTIRKILSTDRRTKNKPILYEQLKKSGYNKVAIVLPVMEKVSEIELVNMVATLPKAALSQKVKEIQAKESEIRSQARFSIDLDDTTEQDLNLLKRILEKEKGYPLSNQEVFKYLLSLAKKSSQIKQKDFSKNKTLTKKHKEYIKSQNHNICQAMNCNRAATEIHHENYQTLNSRHTNLKAYCRIHHQLAHYEVRNKLIEQIKIDKKVQSFWVRE